MNQAERLQERVQEALGNAAQPNKAKSPKAYTFCVTSGKGGVGKTSFAVNFALALSQCGKKVILIDGDFGLSNVNIMLGKNAPYSLEHVVRGEKTLDEVMEQCFPDVWYISGGSGVTELLKLGEEQMEEIVSQLLTLEDEMDYIIFDTGAGMNNNILRMIDASDQTILVMTPEPTSILDSFVVVKTAQELEEKPMMSALINKVFSVQEAHNTYQNFANVVQKHLDYPIGMLGYIVNDSKMRESIAAMVPYVLQNPNSYTADLFRKIAHEVTKTPRKNKEKGIRKFFERLAKGAR